MQPLLISETQTREPVNIPKLHMLTAKMSEQDQQERYYNNQEPFEVARKNHARKRKALKPSKDAVSVRTTGLICCLAHFSWTILVGSQILGQRGRERLGRGVAWNLKSC